MHVNTDSRTDNIRELRPFITEMLPYKENQQNTDNTEAYDEFEDPIHIMSKKVYNSMRSYQNHFFVAPDLEYLSKPIPSLNKNNSLI
jgi:hypothetical protein